MGEPPPCESENGHQDWPSDHCGPKRHLPRPGVRLLPIHLPSCVWYVTGLMGSVRNKQFQMESSSNAGSI